MFARGFPYFWARHINIPIIRRWHNIWVDQALPELLEAQWLSRDELAAHQMAALATLLKHAWDNCPFYRRRMEAAGLEGGRCDSLEDLTRLPILTKREIQEHRDEMVARNLDESELYADHTGGSTGDPLHFFRDRGINTSRFRCREHRGNMMAGWDFGKRAVRLWGAGLDFKPSRSVKGRLRSWAVNEFILDCTRLDEAQIAEQIAFMKAFRPQFVVAYTTIAYMFASQLSAQGGATWQSEGVIVTAETLTPPQREVIEQGFGCKAFNRYGSREVSSTATECGEHRGLHIAADQLILEVVDEQNRPVPPGTPGRIIITDLFNYGMPFLRYDIQDVGVLSDEICPCGRGLPLLTEVLGRESDIIKLPSGRRLACLAIMCGFAQRLKGIRNLQLVRRGPTDFALRIMKGPAYKDEELDYLESRWDELLGGEAHIDYEFVDDIQRNASGKYQFLVSELPADGVH